MGNGAIIPGSTSTTNYIYPASGTYTVSMIVQDLNGCRDTVLRNNYIRVNGPTAGFTSTNNSGCTNLVTTFTDASVTDGVNALQSWTWDFGDGNTQTTSSPSIQHAYTAVGIYSVKMTVRDAAGCTDTLTQVNLIQITDPVPDFTVNNTLTCPGAFVQFTNTTVASPGFTSFWDFGDGTTSTVESPLHSYTSVGRFTVKLIITDIYGCVDSVVKTNLVWADRPRAIFTVNDSIGACPPLEVQFTNASTFAYNLLWDFGPGEGTSSSENPVHYFNTPGTYRVRVYAFGPGNCVDSAFINIVVEDTTGAHIDYTPLSGCNPQQVDFLSIGNITAASYFWDFGDGNTVNSKGVDTAHTYTSFGNFSPKLIIEDPAGCLIALSGRDTVRIAGANANFGIDPGLLCDAGTVRFTDSTTTNGTITSYAWNFGDGGTSSVQHPTHTYTAPGLYTVSLTVRTQDGCSNTLTFADTIKVVRSPSIDILGDTSLCINRSLLHAGIFLETDTSSVQWQWTFPNGNTSTLQNPVSQTYNTAGNFVVTAIAINS
ncbi:MAG: PKD domain-containing protein, partial [Pedobacter sp.]